jgi:hypothetical protein
MWSLNAAKTIKQYLLMGYRFDVAETICQFVRDKGLHGPPAQNAADAVMLKLLVV